MPRWLLIAGFIAIGLIATLFLRRKDAAESPLNDRPGVLLVGRFLALISAGVTLIGTVISVVGTLVSEAVAITVGGLVWQVFFGIGDSIASGQLLDVAGWDGRYPSSQIGDYLMANLEDSGLPGSTLSVPIDFWPALLGLALAELVDLSIVNLSVLKNDRGRAIRFSTLRTMCEALECEVGDLLVVLAPSD